MGNSIYKKIGLVAGPLLFLLTQLFFQPEGLSDKAISVLAITLWVAVWWTLEVVPIAVTSLLPIILFPLTGAIDISTTTQAYGHKYVFLYLGGFILAISIERWNLHKRIALHIISVIGTGMKKIILGFMVATGFLSMWISNTATAVMMLPIGMAIISQLKETKTDQKESESFAKALMLGIGYSASIGGMATLIGTPPNIVLASILEKTYQVEISFFQWMLLGVPLAVLLMFIAWKYLTSFAFSFKQNQFPGGKEEIKRLQKELGPLGFEEKTVLVVFCLTAICWMTRSYLLAPILPGIDDTIIAIAAALLIFLLPTKNKTQKSLLTWEQAVKLPWGVLLLFGGGLALAEGFATTGLAEWIGQQMTSFEHISLFLMLILIVASVNFLTEITSNTATTSMLLPVIVPTALVLNVHPYPLMIGVALAASCAFMLPVATPPNAIVFGSGYLTIPNMLKTGVWMNILSIILIVLLIYFGLPIIWDLELNEFPKYLK